MRPLLLAVTLAAVGCAAPRSAQPSPSANAQRGVADTAAPDLPGAGRKLARNAWFRIEVNDDRDVPGALARIGSLAKELGGYVENERTNGILVKVPGEKYELVQPRLSEIGKVKQQSSRVDDVTANYVDLSIRIENARKLQKRLQELLAQAESVEATLAVERELARVTENLERLEGQMRLLESQTAYANVDVVVDTRTMPGPLGWVFYGLYHGIKWLFVWD